MATIRRKKVSKKMWNQCLEAEQILVSLGTALGSLKAGKDKQFGKEVTSSYTFLAWYLDNWFYHHQIDETLVD